MKKIALALVALTAAATPAFAQDEAADFTGVHGSAIVGFDYLDLNTTGLDNPSGVAYGVNLGYDFQAGRTVFGIEGEFTESTAKVEANNVDVANASRDLYVGGRVGFVTGPTLIYAKAGYTNARVEYLGGAENGDGVRVGTGAEVQLKNNIFFKGEYRYSNYEGDVERHQLVGAVGVRF